MSPSSSRSFYTGVFALSGLLMALQVVQARIFSVTTWYHLSFLIISVAMFGLTAGALRVHRGDADKQRRNCGPMMAQECFRFGLCIIPALVAQMLVPIVTGNVMSTLVTLPLMCFFIVQPYYHAGIALTLAITRAPLPPARTYGFDLLGAAAGCLLALGVMETIDAPSALLLLALGGFAACRCFGKPESARAGAAALVTGIVLLINVALPRPFIYPLWIKSRPVTGADLAYDHWNSISRVTLTTEKKDVPPPLWGPSPRLPQSMKESFYCLNIDGDAGTPLTKFAGDAGRPLSYLDYDVTTVAYALPGLKKSAVIGVGGGRDVLSAYHAGIRDVTALDVNATQIALLTKVEPFRSYTALSGLPGLKLIHSEARSWFAQAEEKFDLIQMSLIDTWAATGAGAFALSENGLYTVEAWKTFLGHLTPGGVMTVSRWYIRDAHSEVQRLVSLAAGTVLAEGDERPEQHIFIATSGFIATLVISRDPFTARQVAAMEKRAKAMDFRILIAPGRKTDSPELAAILGVKNAAELETLAQKSQFDLSPPTDRRPFFFNQVRLTAPLHVFRLVAGNTETAHLGHARAILNLYIIIAFSLAVVVTTIIEPLRREMKPGVFARIAPFTAWFLLIGLGFMLLEISVLQRMSIYLGHPAYGLGIVLFSLVLSTGLGSLACDRWPLETNRTRLLWIAVTAGMAAVEYCMITRVTGAFAAAPLLTRGALCVALVFPLGCLLGFGFPTGMALARRSEAKHTAWFWGINGAAGVMGSALAVACSIAAGLNVTMMAGAVCYALLVVPAWKLRRE